MASTYPGAVDALVRPDGTDPLSDGHAALHNATSDAVEAVQGELGVNPSGSALTVAARFTAAESATGDAQADATTALANAATADGKAVAAQADATTGISNAATAQATANAAVPKASYDAHTILAATTDNTPAAVTVAEQSIVGRKTGGNITALTAAEVKTLLGVTTGDVSGLGTAAVVDVPAAGNATSGQAVKGSDTRLTDARTPTAHKTSHQSGGSDEITLAQAQVTNLTSDLSAKAPLASPTFTGVPAAPTAAVDTNTTQVATTAFTVAQIADDAVAKSAVGNLLTANQASVETDTAGLGKEYQCTVARSTAAARVGSASLAVTCTGAGAWTAGAATNSVGYQVPVVVGQTYTGVVYTKAAATPRAMYANIRFATGANATVSDVQASAITNSTSTWTAYYVTAVAPATAEYAQVYMTSDVTPAANEVHYLDCLGFWEGAGGQWALPGTPITNLGFYTDESVGRRLFQWDANNSRWQMTYGDTGDRQSAITYTNGWANAYGVDMLRRIGNTVYLQVVLDSTSATTDGAFTVPAGFRPSATAMMAVPVGGSTVVPRTLTMGSAGEATIYQASLAGQAGWFVGLAYQTNDAWPTSLPGTASGSIPA